MQPYCILRHIGGDCGPFITGNTFDEVQVVLRDGSDEEKVVATVRLTYAGDDCTFSAVCTGFNHAAAFKLHDELHVVTCVTATILRAFTEDHEFYCDVFHDEEGDSFDLPLFDPLKV